MGSRLLFRLPLIPLLFLGTLIQAPAGELRGRHPVRENPYFPLQVGNQWVYVYPDDITVQPGSDIGPAPSMTVVSVRNPVVGPDGYTYFALENFFAPFDPVGTRRLVRTPSGGAVVELGPGGAPSHLWYLLQAPVGTAWTLSLAGASGSCADGAEIRVASRSDTVRVPAGEFRNVVRLEITPACADAGIGVEWFAPGIGLIQRRLNGLGGSRDMELAWATVGDRQFPGRAYSTTLLLDRPIYLNDLFPVVGPGPQPGGIAVLHATLVIGNGGNAPASFEFDGCKSATFRIRDAAGIEVLKWRGDDGGCCSCGETVQVVLVRDALIIRAGIRLALPDGTRLPDGEYGIEAELDATNLPPPLRPSARAPFRIQTLQ